MPPARQTALVQRGGGTDGHGEGEKPGSAAPLGDLHRDPQTRHAGGVCTGPFGRMRPAFSDKGPWFLVHGDRIIPGLTCRACRLAETGDRAVARSGPQSARPVLGCAVRQDLQAGLGPLGSRDHHRGKVTSRRHVLGTGREGGEAALGQRRDDCPPKLLTLTESVTAKPSLPARPGATGPGDSGPPWPGRRGLRHGGEHRRASRPGLVPPASGTVQRCVSPAPAGGLRVPKPRCPNGIVTLTILDQTRGARRAHPPAEHCCPGRKAALRAAYRRALGGRPGGLGQRMDGRAADKQGSRAGRAAACRGGLWQRVGTVLEKWRWGPPEASFPAPGGHSPAAGPSDQSRPAGSGQCRGGWPVSHALSLGPSAWLGTFLQIWGGRRGSQFCL